MPQPAARRTTFHSLVAALHPTSSIRASRLLGHNEPGGPCGLHPANHLAYACQNVAATSKREPSWCLSVRQSPRWTFPDGLTGLPSPALPSDVHSYPHAPTAEVSALLQGSS